jgi:hypothetical protein
MNRKIIIGILSALAIFIYTVSGSFAQIQSGTINQLNQSAVSGTYRLEAINENQTRVTVNLQGMEPESSHAGHFHEGTCADIGPVTLPLDRIEADQNGRGSMTKTVNSSLQNIYSGDYLISYHEGGDDTLSIACAAIPARSISNTDTSPVPLEVPRTGMGGMSR